MAVNTARQPEKQDKRQTNDEGWRYDWQDGECAQKSFVRKCRTRNDKRKCKPQKGCDQSNCDSQKKRIPRRATTPAHKATQAPKPVVEELRREYACRQSTVLGDKCGDQHFCDRKENEGCDDDDYSGDRTDHEDAAVDRTTCRDTLSEEKQEG